MERHGFPTFLDGWRGIHVVLIICLVVYCWSVYIWDFDADEFLLFCPFYKITGFKCIGCGGQRAFHYLLHGDFSRSFRCNPFLYLLVPEALMVFVLTPRAKWNSCVVFVAAVVLAVTVLRNIFNW